MLQLIFYAITAISFWICSLTSPKSENTEDIQLLLYKNGEVLKETFVYFNVQDEGDIRFTLNSLEGDADMYIAQQSKVPTYEPDTYDLHSASCGEDVIDISYSFKRPVVIGIYGNSAFDVTKYHLKVERLLDSENHTFYLNSEEIDEQLQNGKKSDTVNKVNSKPRVKNKFDIKSGLFGLLEMIAMVL